MSAVAIQNVCKQFGSQVVLDNVSLDLHAGEIAGLIGANGSGKTTLFRLIAGEIPPEKGTITRSRGLEIGFLKQEPEICPDRTLHDEVGMAFANLLALEERLHDIAEQMSATNKAHDADRLAELMETYERINARFIAAGGHTFETRLGEILGGLGFTPADYARSVSVLSGGEKCRVALAKLLLSDSSFLLLDEPTNHLDIDAVRWLEKFLAGHRGGAVIISHDRYLLDRLCDRIIEIENNQATSYPGNYTNYAKTKAVRTLTQQRRFEKDSEFIKKEQAFIDKHIAGQRTKEAQGRRKRLRTRLQAGEFVTDNPKAARSASFRFEKSEHKAATVVRCDEVGMRYDSNVLLKDVTFQVHAGQCVGITGPNGTGKTTLLRIILGEVAPIAGNAALDRKLTVGYYSQEPTDLDPGVTILDELRRVCPHASEQSVRAMLGRYMFTGNDVFKPLGMLSGGEQSRVRLAKLILEQPDVLILDEPTNHLDIPSREALEEALLEFPGTVLAVSHDRYFLNRVVDRLLVIRRGGHALYEGNYSFYIEQVESQRATEKAQGRAPRRRRRELPAGEKRAASQPSPYDRMSIDELETLIIEREAELAALNQRFGDPAQYKNPASLAELRRQVQSLSTEIAELDAAWQERAEYQ